jgi:uncharacterized SAM-binding protein YcdF (DUF218 family)
MSGSGLKQAFLTITRLAVRVCVVFTVSLLLLTVTPLIPWLVGRLCGPVATPDGDVLIVLSGDSQPDGLIGRVSYPRAAYAVKAWRTGHFRSIVVSGGYMDGNPRSLAAVIGDYLAGSGIPRDRIFLEERSTSTRQNALFTKAMIGSWPGRKLLVTSDLHMFRARRAFEKLGLRVEPYPSAEVTKYWRQPENRIPLAVGSLIEFLKIAVYRAYGWIDL